MRWYLFLFVLALHMSACGGCDDTADKLDPDAAGTSDMGDDANGVTDGGDRPDTDAPDATGGGDGGGDDAGDASTTPTAALDVLIVLDNSGSACRAQERLRDGFRAMLGPLTDARVDVQLGITTTHMNPDYPLEPVAVPGNIQSTPQPIPGFDRSCHGEAGDYSPIRASLEAALACSNVDPADYQWTDADIECALYNQPQGCTLSIGQCQGPSCTSADLFPPPDSYDALPKVLVVEAYRDETGKLDFEQLERDFACMSLAGSRGYGVEKGLAAAALATSPALIGGSAENPVDAAAPNHGLLREDADFGLVFVTDENDCSHDGTLAEDTACGGDVCEFANREGAVDSPLIPVADFKDEIIANLRAAKGADFDEFRIRLGGIHGPYDRFDGPVPTDAECGSANYAGIEPACEPPDAANVAFSGDRYDRFLGEFSPSNVFPTRGADGYLPGLICEEDLESHLRDLGDVLTP